MPHRGPEKQFNQSEPNRPREQKRRRPAVFTVVAPLLWLSLVLLASCSWIETGHTSSAGRKALAQSARVTQSQQSTERASERAMKDTAWDPAWPPIPGAGKPAKAIEEVRAMYAFAARHPEVLQYAPCYCGCENLGHESVRDCFVKGRDANGGPQWDSMGFT